MKDNMEGKHCLVNLFEPRTGRRFRVAHQKGLRHGRIGMRNLRAPSSPERKQLICQRISSGAAGKDSAPCSCSVDRATLPDVARERRSAQVEERSLRSSFGYTKIVSVCERHRNVKIKIMFTSFPVPARYIQSHTYHIPSCIPADAKAWILGVNPTLEH